MKKFILIFFLPYLVIIAQPNNKGPYEAGWTNATLNREGRILNTIIYYPSFVEGSEAQIDTLHKPYQVIAFGHGFFMQNSYYISHYKHLASYGFVVIAPQFPDNNHLQLAYDLIYCVNYIKNQSSVSTSRFYNLIDLIFLLVHYIHLTIYQDDKGHDKKYLLIFLLICLNVSQIYWKIDRGRRLTGDQPVPRRGAALGHSCTPGE
jgi:hypothetical protein